MKLTKFLMFAVLFALPTAARAQQVDPAKILGQTPESGSLPLWSKPSGDARTELGKVARTTEKGVFLVGMPGKGHGTAWCVSKKHRLLVTNAHVADIRMRSDGKIIAIPSLTSNVYTVDKVWYHPGVRRYLNGTKLSVRSVDPKDGAVDCNSPDLAVLQLSSDGPDLTVEFPVATAEDLATLFAMPAAILGFPGHDTRWPELGQTPAATYHDGVISRLTNFEMNPGAPASELQFLQYTMSEWGGFSGSPILLPNGRVAAAHNMARFVEGQGGETKVIPHGIRVDCLFELLVHHGIDDKVPFKIDKTKVQIDRWLKPDEKTEKARANYADAVTLIREAEYQIFVKLNYELGETKCNQALKLAPNFDKAYSVRSFCLLNFQVDNANRLSKASKIKLVESAWADAKKCNQLAPSDPLHIYLACSVKNAMAFITGNKEFYEESVAILNRTLSSESLTTGTRARLTSARATAKGNLGEHQDALRDHNEAVRLAPTASILVENRGQFLEALGWGDHGAADYARAKKLRETSTEMGMKITDISKGGAASDARLQIGDIIVSVGETRVRNLDELVAALAASKGPTEIEIINGQSKKREKASIVPVAGKIGVAVEQVELK